MFLAPRDPTTPKFPKSKEIGWCSGNDGCGCSIDRRSFSRHRTTKHRGQNDLYFQSQNDPSLPKTIDKIKFDQNDNLIKLRIVEIGLMTEQIKKNWHPIMDVAGSDAFLEFITNSEGLDRTQRNLLEHPIVTNTFAEVLNAKVNFPNGKFTNYDCDLCCEEITAAKTCVWIHDDLTRAAHVMCIECANKLVALGRPCPFCRGEGKPAQLFFNF